MSYISPERQTWSTHLNGASFTDMTETSRTAKKPIFLGTGGKTISEVIKEKGHSVLETVKWYEELYLKFNEEN